jgi:hypothetical protein
MKKILASVLSVFYNTLALRKPKPPVPEPPPFVMRLLLILARIQDILKDAVTAVPDQAFIAVAGWAWIERLAFRLDSLVIRMQSGTLKPLRQPGDAKTPSGQHDWPLPRCKGWLLPALPRCENVVAAISCLLSEHEIRLLFGREPIRFGRLLRPLARALALPEPVFPTSPAAPPPLAAVPTPTPPPQTQAKPAFAFLDPLPSLWSTLKTT